MSLPIVWFDMSSMVVERASGHDYVTQTGDFIHIATMELNEMTEIISADAEFDRVGSVKRVDPLRYR